MYHKIVWCYVFVLTLLDISPNSKLSAQGKSHGVSVHDSLAEGVTFQEWGGSSSSSGEGGGAAGGGGAGGGRARAAAEGVSLQPPALHFGHAPLAAPHARSITLTNVANATLHLASVAGTTPDFHASFFESKTLAPQANTTFSVVYLGRREGPVSAHLYIHTSLGVFKYPVSAVGVANPWGVWPLVDVRVPLNATVEPLLTMHNPTEHTIQVSEVYSSGAWLGLALPEGGEWAPRDRWTLPPHSSRAIVRLRLQPPHHHHHHHSLTAYVRIKGNMTGGGLVVGVEARAAPAGEYLAPVQLGLRVRGSRDPPDTFQLEAGNSMAAPLSVEAGVWGARCGAAERWSPPPPPPEPAPHEPAPHHHNGHADAPAHNGEKSEGVYLTLIRSQLEPHQRLTKAAELTLDYAQMWSSYSEAQSAEQDAVDGAGAAGEAWCAGWARVGRAALRYAVRLLPGTLRAEPPALHVVTARGEEAQAAREVRLHNEFPVPVRLMAAHCPAEVLEHFHCETPVPMTLAPGAAAAVLLLRPRAPLAPHLALHAPLTFHTNLTSCTVPLLVYSGRLALEWEWPNSSEGALRLGTVGTSSTRRVGVRVLNPGPARLCVAELRVELPGAQLALAACAHLRPVPPDHACRCVEGYGAARGVLTVVAPARAGRVRGWLELRSEHAGLRAELELHAHAGRLRAHALHLPAAAPYAWSSAPLVLESSMAALRMQVVNVTQPTPDPAVKFVPTPDVDVTTGRHTVGEVLFMPEKLCEPNCYTGLDIATAEGARWAARGGGGLRTDAALARARRALYAALAPRNVSLHVHTTHVVQIPVAGSAQWRWPRVLDAAGAGGAALAAVGAAAALQVRARNPSPAHRLLLQPVLADAHYDVTGTTESSFCKTENCVWSRDAFKLTEWKAIRGEARVWDASADGTAGVEATHNVSDHVMPMLVLEPETELEIKITFSPKEPSALSTYFYLRNNLTILEGVQLLGRGAYPSFEIGGRRPGTNAPLLFEVKDCGSTGATVVRTVLARNTGVVPVWLRDWRLAGQPCHARGFRLQPCAPLALAPNESRHLHLAFTADYTLARVPCRLSLRADSAPADFSLVAVAPAALLPRCHAAASRPPFEPAMRAGGTLLALTVLALVLVAAVLDAERELNRARPPRPPVAAAARAPLDLRALADEPAPPPPPAPRARPPPPRRRRTPRRPPPPPDPQAERRAFERWRTEMLRVADDDDSRSSEDADAEVARNDSHDERPPPREPPPEPVEIDAGVANDGYEADPETEERTPGSGDEDADSTGSTSASASSTPADEHDGEDNDDRARTPVDVEPPPDSSPKTDVGRPTDSQPRAGRTRREPGDAPRRAERTRAEPDAAARARAPPGKQHARRDNRGAAACAGARRGARWWRPARRGPRPRRPRWRPSARTCGAAPSPNRARRPPRTTHCSSSTASRTRRAPTRSTRGAPRRQPTARPSTPHRETSSVGAKRQWALWAQWARARSVRWARCGARWSRRRGRGARRATRRCARRPASRPRRRRPRACTTPSARSPPSGGPPASTGARRTPPPPRPPPPRRPRPPSTTTTSTSTSRTRTPATTSPRRPPHHCALASFIFVMAHVRFERAPVKRIIGCFDDSVKVERVSCRGASPAGLLSCFEPRPRYRTYGATVFCVVFDIALKLNANINVTVFLKLLLGIL